MPANTAKFKLSEVPINAYSLFCVPFHRNINSAANCVAAIPSLLIIL